MTILIRFSLFFLLFGLLTACGSDLRGKPAPDFERVDLDGELQALEKHRGKVVMLYFWADWCPTCKKEFPQTQEYYEELAGEDFELLAINVAQPKEASEAFREKYGATFPMLTDEKSEITDLYNVEILPTNYFIDPEGKIIRRIDGFVDKNQARVMIKQHRKEK
ncbi:MAG: redoxin domain-containing protein [Bacteroidota bacterium]